MIERLRPLVARLDRETRGLARDSSILVLGHVAVTAGFMGQIVLITHILGLAEYGKFALVVATVSLVSRFFDVQVSPTVTAFAAEKLKRDWPAAAGVMHFGYLVELGSGAAGMLVIAAVAPLVGPRLIGEDGILLLILFAVTLLASTVDTTSLTLLRLLDRYRVIFVYLITREAARVALVGLALGVWRSLVAVVLVLVLLDVGTAVLGVALASIAFRRDAGFSFLRPSLHAARGERGPMIRMMLHTNFVAYAKLVQSQVPTLLLGAFKGHLEVGVFKVGMAVATPIGRINDPLVNAVMPRLSRLWSEGRRDDIRRLVAQATAIATGIFTVVAVVIVLLRDPILRLVGGAEADLAGTVLILAVAAQAINAILFWNSSLLWSAKRASAVSKVYAWNMAVFVPVLVVATRLWGANGAAAAFLLTAVVGNVGFTAVALRLLAPQRVSDRPAEGRV